MNKLRIISDTVEHGNVMGFELHLSSPMFEVITSTKDLDRLPNSFVFIDDIHHPLEVIAIKEVISKEPFSNVIDLKNKEHVIELLEAIRGILTFNNQAVLNSTATNILVSTAATIESNINSMGFNLNNGFNFKIQYDYTNKFFWIQATTGKMEVIVNLFRGYIQNLYKQVRPVDPIQMSRVPSIHL